MKEPLETIALLICAIIISFGISFAIFRFVPGTPIKDRPGVKFATHECPNTPINIDFEHFFAQCAAEIDKRCK